MISRRILIVEDNVHWVELVKVWLKGAGFPEFYVAYNGAEGIELARKSEPDCILLDIVLPDMDGMEVCKMIRSIPSLGRTPVILFTAHKKDKITGLEYGADYFVQKNENPRELLATLHAVFRRRDLDQNIMRKGDVSLDVESRRVHFRGLPVARLTPKTFELLHVLIERSPEPVHKDLLFSALEGKKKPELSRALDVLMNRLRKALPIALQRRIKAVKGFGYVYIPPSEEGGAPPLKKSGRGKKG